MPSPLLNDETFQKLDDPSWSSLEGAPVMTVGGTVARSLFLLALCGGAGWFAWGAPHAPLFIWGGLIAGALLSLIVAFFPKTAPWLAPICAVAEGVFLGALSFFYQALYDGIVLQALLITAATFVGMLGCYQTGLLRPTRRFVALVTGATAGILLFYLIHLGARLLFGYSFPIISGSSTLAIGFSLFVCGVAAFNLIIDFGVIEEGAQTGAPKYMEWYAAFGLMVTLVWLYIEILRLLSKLQRR